MLLIFLSLLDVFNGLNLLIKNIQETTIRKLLGYRDWIYNPKSSKTKLWIYCLKHCIPKNAKLFTFQDVLPKYPLPSLKATCEKLLKNIKPLVSLERFEEIQTEMKYFEKNEGPNLQKILQKKYETEENWVSKIWDNYAYLAGRYPLLYTNFCFGGGLKKTDLTPVYSSISQASLAANLIYHTANFCNLVRSGQLNSILMMDLVPICNEKYKFLFSTRIPRLEIDEIKSFINSKHIVIFRNGQMFKLPVYTNDETGSCVLLSPEEIQKQVENIIETTHESKVEFNPSVFTTLNRNEWYKIRNSLISEKQNGKSLHEVESALFHVVLENSSPKDLTEECRSNLLGNGLNRWYDKSLTHIIYENGVSGGNVEHSPVDATIPSRALEFLFAHMRFDSEGNAVLHSSSASSRKMQRLTFATKIKWEINTLLHENMETTLQLHSQQSQNIDMEALKLFAGKGEIKKLKVSPDSFMQMSLQLAFYKIHKFTPKTYETAMTRFFKLGRTETIRTVSKHSVEFTKAMLDKNSSKEEKLTSFKKAVMSHNMYKLDAMSGRGCDRSWFGLKVVAQQTGLPIPKIFSFKEISSGDQLSTSQSPYMYDKGLKSKTSSYPSGGAYAPQTNDGYGVFYLYLGDDFTTVHISSYRSNPKTDSKLFGEKLQESIQEIKDLLR